MTEYIFHDGMNYPHEPPLKLNIIQPLTFPSLPQPHYMIAPPIPIVNRHHDCTAIVLEAFHMSKHWLLSPPSHQTFLSLSLARSPFPSTRSWMGMPSTDLVKRGWRERETKAMGLSNETTSHR